MKIKKEILQQIIAHAIEHNPLEACGYLAEKDGVVDRLIRLSNLDHSNNHYTLDPREQFEAVKLFKEEGRKVRAAYHSHPESPACMSNEDIRLAYDPNISYVICSLMEELPVVKSFKCQQGTVEVEGMLPLE